MSKSLGNVIDPYEIIEKYGVEPLRYFLLSQIPTLDDGDFTIEGFEAIYQANLANGLGNLIARVAKLCEGINFDKYKLMLSKEYKKDIENYRLNEVLQIIWTEIKSLDKYINDKEPWGIEEKSKKLKILQPAVNRIRQIGYELRPFLPETAEKIEKQFKGPKIKSGKPLFPRLR